MSTAKKQISKAQIIVLVSIVLAIAAVVTLSLILYEREHASGPCCPWCATTCPWCWIVVDIAIILVYGVVLFAMTAPQTVAAVVEQPLAQPRHRAHRNVTIPPQRKHRPRHGSHAIRHAKQYDATVSLKQLMQVFEEGAIVTIEHLKELGLIHHKADGYKVLVGDQEKMDRSMTIHATSFSAQAKHEIHLAGGKAIKVYG